MPKVSVNILTKNRPKLLRKALLSVAEQSFRDFEVRVISDGSLNVAQEKKIEEEFIQSHLPVNFVFNNKSLGITISRKNALEMSKGEYVAILDDDDEWLDSEKMAKQAEFLDSHPEYVLVGGAMEAELGSMKYELRMRPISNTEIRRTMLFRNNFFTSTVMFRREAALKAGGFIKDQDDFCEDYDLWLRLGKLGKMHNFQEVFAKYTSSQYSAEKRKAFFQKQLRLIGAHKSDYPWFSIARALLKMRIVL